MIAVQSITSPVDSGNYRIYTALIDGVFVGSCTVKRDADQWYLTMMAVDKWARRRGVARSILEEVLLYNKRERGPVIVLSCRKDNPGARSLYDQAGFVQYHEDDLDNWLMWDSSE